MIQSITLWRYRIPLVSPLQLKPQHLNRPFLTHREGLVLQWHHSKGIDWSEVSPLPGFSKESLDEAEEQLNQFLKNHLAQLTKCRDLQSLHTLIKGKLYPSVQFGLEMGLMKLTQFNPIIINETHAIAGLITDQHIDIERYTEYPVIKVKVGRQSLTEDINNINKTIQAIDKKQTLRLDSNQSWTFEQAKHFFSAIPTKQIEFIEEPLKVNSVELENYKNWSVHISVPFAFDEQVQHPNYELTPIKGLSTLVIKPMLVGLSRTLEIADKAERLGINIVISSSYESSLSLNYLYQLSKQIPNALPPGLDTFLQLKFDLIEALALPCKYQTRPLLDSACLQSCFVSANTCT